mmetsp:Transcript_21058/g.40075  ORF Transcript_21058/g.40075 Transcript_21058/m.40075 type:complete len:93 (+) Transcript_21058:113-391(+)
MSSEERREFCQSEALNAGIVSALQSLAVSAPTVWLANRYIPAFSRTTVSVKTAVLVSPFFFSFFLRSELTMNACAQKRKAYEQSGLASPTQS